MTISTSGAQSLTIVFSTLNWNQLRPDEIGFTGLSNYTAVFASPEFVQSLWATVTITGSLVILSLLLGMGLALLMDRSFPGRAIARTLVITPFLVMPAAAALIPELKRQFEKVAAALKQLAGS